MHRRTFSWRPRQADLMWAAVFAAVLSVGTLGAASHQDQGVRTLDFWAFALVVAAALATLGWRRAAPLWALTASVTAVSAYLLAGYPYGPVQLCLVMAMFEVARQRPPKASAMACAVAALAASTAMWARVSDAADAPVLLALGWTAWIVLPWSLGALVSVTTSARNRARRELTARVVAEERMRLAEEVHDVAGHGFALVAMHAGVALLVLEEKPEQARALLQAIKSTIESSLA